MGICHLAHVLTVSPTKACLLCVTPAGIDLYIQLPWISKDRLLHMTRVQWPCSEAENSAVCSCHCEALRVHLKLRRSTSVHMMVIIICCGYCKFPPYLLHFSFVCTHACCSCKIYQFVTSLTVYHSFSVCSVPLCQSFTW